jgi:hypothetical protein
VARTGVTGAVPRQETYVQTTNETVLAEVDEARREVVLFRYYRSSVTAETRRSARRSSSRQFLRPVCRPVRVTHFRAQASVIAAAAGMCRVCGAP